MDVDPPGAGGNSAGRAGGMNGQREVEGVDDTPALFMTSMPRDVWANPSLGSLAALIDEAQDEENKDAGQGAKHVAVEPVLQL